MHATTEQLLSARDGAAAPSVDTHLRADAPDTAQGTASLISSTESPSSP